MKEYTPGQGSYRVEEAGALSGIGTTQNVDNNFGTLVFNHTAFDIPVRGVNLSLSARFDSDKLYSVVIPRISKGEQPEEEKLITLPGSQDNFYKICSGWQWNLPYVLYDQFNMFKFAPGNGKIFDLVSTITEEAYGDGEGNECWTEGYHVKYGSSEGTQVSPVTIVIPEIQKTIACSVYRTNTAPYDFKVQTTGFSIYNADGSKMEFNANGYVLKYWDMSGKNSITFYYDTYSNGVITGQVGTISQGQGRKTFPIEHDDYENTIVGDLISIRDETRSIFSKDANDVITVSCNFDVAIEQGNAYTIHKGKLQKIVHDQDGRCVKFYYYIAGGLDRITLLLSSDADLADFAAGDLFLGRYTVNSQAKQLVQYEVLDTVKETAEIGTFQNNLSTNESSYFSSLQKETYEYAITNNPDPATDYITIKNHVGASTKYYFQKGTFCSHTWNNEFFHSGMVRRGSTMRRMIIERPDFYIDPSKAYVNLSRIDDKAFEDVSKDNYQKDENGKEFAEDVFANDFNFFMSMAIAATGYGNWTNPLGALGAAMGIELSLFNYLRTKNRWSQHAAIAACAQPVTEWVKVDGVLNANTLTFNTDLAERPRQNDVYVVLNASATPTFRYTSRTSRNARRIYVDYTGTPDFGDGDLVFLRHECRRINECSTEYFGSTPHKYIEVDRDFSFVPFEKEHVAFVYEDDEDPAEYYVYYLNKPKVVRAENRDSDSSSEFISIDYEYTYQCGGSSRVDDFSDGGFSASDVQGPSEDTLNPEQIGLNGVTITTSKQALAELMPYKEIMHEFSYTAKGELKGETGITTSVKKGDDWCFVEKKGISYGRPCWNAGYIAEIGHTYWQGHDGNGGPSRKPIYRVDNRFDGYGRVIREKKISNHFGDTRTLSTWTQYVGSRSSDDQDPLGKFDSNPYSKEYQSILDSKHALGLVGATRVQVEAKLITLDTYNKYDLATGNLIETRIIEKTNLDGIANDNVLTIEPDFRASAEGTTVQYAENQENIGWRLPNVEGGNIQHGIGAWEPRGVTPGQLPRGWRELVTEFSYDGVTNNLIEIVKPLGNSVEMTYGASGWLASFIVKDTVELLQNLDGNTQFIVNSYDYDVKGRLKKKVVRFKTDDHDDDENQYNSADYPKSAIEYSYDGMNRVTLKKLGSVSTLPIQKNTYDMDNLLAKSTSYLGIRTKTWFDTQFRPIEVKTYKPDTDVGGDLDYDEEDEVLIGWTKTTYDLLTGKPYEVTKFTSADGADEHRIINRNTYDELSRLIKIEYRNTDSSFEGSATDQFKTQTEIEFDDKNNSVLTKSYLEAGASNCDFIQTKEDNDWLGRGPLRETSWAGVNGTGVARISTHFYSPAGKLLRTTLASGETYRFIYDNLGRLNCAFNSDGTSEKTYFNENGKVVQRIDRSGEITLLEYNSEDMPVRQVALDSGLAEEIVVSTKHCHFGKASVKETEEGSDIATASLTYHFSGAVKRTTEIDNIPQTDVSRYVENGYDAAGNQTSLRASGDGGAFDRTLAIVPTSYDSNNYNSVIIKEGSEIKVLVKNNFLGLVDQVKFGTDVRHIAHTYDSLLRVNSIVSNEATPMLSVHLARDVLGNIRQRKEPADGSAIDNSYEYDGMNRLSSGEGETCIYDALSNIASRGSKSYTYEAAGSGKNQMRMASFQIGSGSARVSTHDANGRITAMTNNADRYSTLSYDRLGRLREVARTAGTDKYWYNSVGLRFKKEEGSTTTYTMYSGNNPLFEEKYISGNLVESRLNLIVGISIIAQLKKAGGNYTYEYFGVDQLGNRRVVWNEAGTAQEKFVYTAWGEFTRTGGDEDALASFTGKQYDGTGLIYFNARYYDPIIGRFLTEDPSKKGHSWYSYCENNPVNRTDPTGKDVLNPGESGLDLVWPTSGGVSSEYGPRTPIEYTTASGRPGLTSAFHEGIDIASKAGTPVIAAGHGTIVTAVTGGEGALGNYVVVKHPTGMTTTYAHLEAVNVVSGQRVEQGGQVGLMGATGASTGPHTHFKISDPKGAALNPRLLIQGQPEVAR